MRRETEQMAGMADARQGSTPAPVPLATQIAALTHTANNRLSRAIAAEHRATQERVEALAEQNQALLALAAVIGPGEHHELTRARELQRQAGVGDER